MRKELVHQTPEDKSSYAHLNKLEMSLFKSPPYTICHLTDNMMDVPINDIVDSRKRTKTRSKFLKDLSFNFKIAVMKYERPGSCSNAVVVWKMPPNENRLSPRFQGCLIEASYLAKKQKMPLTASPLPPTPRKHTARHSFFHYPTENNSIILRWDCH